MIRRDYILRMIAEFLEVLSRLQALKKGQLWSETSRVLDTEFERLVGAGADTVANLSDTDLLARVIRGEPTQVVREKTLLLVTVLKEAGDTEAAQDHASRSRTFYLKALHLLLDVAADGDAFAWPDFVPNIDMLTAALADGPLPVPTLARLMQHYERAGEFAKAEDSLFALIEADPQAPGLLEFGTAFYERLKGHPDAHLAEGNLPRAEVEAGLAELRDSLAK